MSEENIEADLRKASVSDLHILAALDDDQRLEELIIAGANTEMRDDKGRTPLHIAAAFWNEKAVRTLLKHGANVYARGLNNVPGTPLHVLAGCNPQRHKPSPATPASILEAFCNYGEAEKLLFACDEDNWTPFHVAAANENAPLLKEMLNVYHTRLIGTSATEASCSNPQITTSIPDLRTKHGNTPLHLAAEKGDLEAVCVLLEAGADRYARDEHGMTPFHVAASRSGNTLVLEALKLQNIDDATPSTQLTALHHAAISGCVKSIRWLLEQGAFVDAVHSDDFTPLHMAAVRGESAAIECLILEGGANPHQLSNQEAFALGIADDRGHHDAAKVLVRAIKMRGADGMRDSLWTPHITHGASLLHYFAAYGTAEDMQWILALIQKDAPYQITSRKTKDWVNKRDEKGRTVAHWAAIRGNIGVVRVLAEHKADLNAESRQKRYKTPLALALMNREIEFAEELLKWKPKASKADNWLRGIRTWMYDYYLDDDKKLKKKLTTLRKGFKEHTNVSSHDDKTLFSEFPPLYLALHAKRPEIAEFIQRHMSTAVQDAVNEKGLLTGRIALHWATLLRQRKIVAQLCRVKKFARELTANAEDKHGKTALRYATEMKLAHIEKELMLRSDVKSSVDAMYKDRQAYVDAANAILVGAALIAGVTFAGWLQPPLSYTPYYNLPQLPPPSPPDIFQAYAAVQQHIGVRCFWVFNSLSFSFAVATVIAGLVAVVPIPGTYIASSVAHLRRCLLIASALLGLSIVFVLAAFAAAGFAVLPPVFEYQANMMATVIVGGIPCLLLLVWFAYRLWSLRPEWVRAIEARILSQLHVRRCSRQAPAGEYNDAASESGGSSATSMLSELLIHYLERKGKASAKCTASKKLRVPAAYIFPEFK